MQEKINSKYKILCEELGHLSSNKKKIEQRMEAIEVEISTLDSMGALLEQTIAEAAEKQRAEIAARAATEKKAKKAK